MNLRWLASPLASAMYAAECLAAGGRAAHPRLATALAAPLAALRAALEQNNVPGGWWGHVVPLAAGVAEPRQLVQVSLTKVLGRAHAEVLAPRLAGPLRELARAYLAQFADLAAELELRSGPLREQWEARGPGMLAVLGRLVDPQLLAPQADVVLVEPLLGGHGLAHLAYNSVTFEAVLANPHEDLPEAVRLAWLLSTLHLESGRFGERLPRAMLECIGLLAMVPPILAAAQQCELVGDSPALLARALAAWGLAASGASAPMVSAGPADGDASAADASPGRAATPHGVGGLVLPPDIDERTASPEAGRGAAVPPWPADSPTLWAGPAGALSPSLAGIVENSGPSPEAQPIAAGAAPGLEEAMAPPKATLVTDAEALADELATWWQTYLSHPVPWSVALEALHELLRNQNGSQL